MKTPVAVTLIIMGALLVMTPAVSDYFFQRNLVALLSRPGVTNATLDGKMNDLYRIGCWGAGAVMIGLAVVFSLLDGKEAAKDEALGILLKEVGLRKE